MLYVVGLGLGDEKDITVNGLEAVKRCERVYLEAYTSILGVHKERLEALYGREVVVADREFVEQGIDGMLNEALKMDVAFLVDSFEIRPILVCTSRDVLSARSLQLLRHVAPRTRCATCCKDKMWLP